MKLDMDKETKLQQWGEGKWVDEPDFEKFEHEGLECVVNRMSSQGGYLCGYVRIPNDHTLYGNDLFLTDIIDIHGEITFDQKNDGKNWIGFNETTDGKEHWVGFDCAHACDIVPLVKKVMSRTKDLPKGPPPLPLPKGTHYTFYNEYRDWDFVVAETKKLASQIHALQ